MELKSDSKTASNWSFSGLIIKLFTVINDSAIFYLLIGAALSFAGWVYMGTLYHIYAGAGIVIGILFISEGEPNQKSLSNVLGYV